MNLQQLATSALFQFTTSTRDLTGYTFYKTLDNCPQWVTDVIFSAHDNGQILPDDYRYEFIYTALDLIANTDDVDDIEIELDCYHSCLLQWLSSRNDRADYCDRYYEEFGGDKKEDDLMKQITMGNWFERYGVLQSVITSLQEIID